jgi:ferredoxin
MNAAIREGKCKGYGYCADLAPNVYQLDGAGFNDLVGHPPRVVTPALHAEAIEGMDACPMRAIVLQEIGDDEPR